MSFNALETRFEALKSSFETDFNRLRWLRSQVTAGVGLLSLSWPWVSDGCVRVWVFLILI